MSVNWQPVMQSSPWERHEWDLIRAKEKKKKDSWSAYDRYWLLQGRFIALSWRLSRYNASDRVTQTNYTFGPIASACRRLWCPPLKWSKKVRIHMQKYCKARPLNDRCNLTRAFEDVLQQIIISSRVGAHHVQLK
jgi:hypothetical protein